jgi:outer membrane protein assembly factor BamB
VFVGTALLTVWWLFFSPFRWRFRLVVFVIYVLSIPAALYFGVRKFELKTLDAGLVPFFQFVWEPSPLERFESHQQNEAAPDSLPPIDIAIGPEDYPRFRGLKLDGNITHLKLETDWVKHPPQVLWRRPVVEGYSGLAVAGNAVVTMEQRGAEECIVCYDRGTGRQRWVHSNGSYYKDKTKMGDGPRATPTIHDGLIFTIGAAGEVVCLNAKGEPQWSRNVLKEGQAKNVKWGISRSPLIVNDMVIAHAGVDKDNLVDSALIAYDYKTGEKVWATGNRAAAYASPQLVTLGKTPQILLFDAAGLVSYDLKGKELWQHEWRTKEDMNMSQPVVFGDDRVFITSELDNGCAMLQISPPASPQDSWNVKTLWKTKSLAGRFANPVTDGKNIYGLQFLNGVLRCIDARDGRLRWAGDRYGPGQMLIVDDVLLIVSDDGVVSLIATDTDEPKVLATFRALEGITWNTPTIAGDQLFIRNQKEIVCIKLARK